MFEGCEASTTSMLPDSKAELIVSAILRTDWASPNCRVRPRRGGAGGAPRDAPVDFELFSSTSTMRLTAGTRKDYFTTRSTFR